MQRACRKPQIITNQQNLLKWHKKEQKKIHGN